MSVKFNNMDGYFPFHLKMSVEDPSPIFSTVSLASLA